MLIRNSETRFGQLARLLHWSSVALLVLAVYTSTLFSELEEGADRSNLLVEHVSYGLFLLLVMLGRFYWRQTNHNPLLSYSIHAAQKRAAISVHWFIYAAVVVQCVLGICQIVVAGEALTVFDWQISGPLMEADSPLTERLNDVHKAIADAIYIVLGIHIIAAIYHQVFGVLEELD